MRKVVCIKKISPEIDEKLLEMGFSYSLECPDVETNLWTGVDRSNIFEHFDKILYEILKDELCDEFIECDNLDKFYEECRNI